MDKQRLEDIISTHISASDTVIETLTSVCLTASTEKESDLALLREEDLVPAVTPILARKFLLSIQGKAKPTGKL